MIDVIQVRFLIDRSTDGTYRASCRELGAYVEAPTLPVLESRLSLLAHALLVEPGARQVQMIVRRVFPSRRASA
jgi:hypothetical protein